MKSSVIRARVDDVLKAQARAVLASCGLEMSDALRLFLIQVVNQGGLPFPVRQVARRGSAKKPKQMKRNSQARDRALVAQGGAVEATAQDLKQNMLRATRDSKPQKLPKPE
jgi:DNA-damage-inducible protein J